MMDDVIMALNTLHKNELEAQRRYIHDELAPYFDDYMLSKDDPMDVELGNIYRDQLQNIFIQLKKLGIF